MIPLYPSTLPPGRRRESRVRAYSALVLCTVVALACTAPVAGPRAVAGSLDLTGWDFGSSGNVTVAGDWMACWGKLLEPGELECPGTGWQPVGASALWYEKDSGSPIGGRGVATYRMHLRLPPEPKRLSLRAGAPMTTSHLWIDGIDHGGTGVVGSSAETTTIGTRRNLVSEFESRAEVVLWLHIANFEFRGGGIRRPWVIGENAAIQSMAGRMLLREAMLFGVGVLVGLAYLVQFAIRPAEKARGYFGLVALTLGLRAIPASISDFSVLLVPAISFGPLLRLEYLGLAFTVFAGAGYFLYKVPNVLPPKLIRTTQAIGLALVPITLFAPFELVLSTIVFYFVLPPLVLAIVLVGYGRAWMRGVPGVTSTLVASGLYLLVVGHDLLRVVDSDLGSTLELFPYFIVIWILAEANEGMQIFNRTFARVESLSDDLAEANFELQETESAVVRFVPFDLLRLLRKRSIREIDAGDHAFDEMTILHCRAHGVEAIEAELVFGVFNNLVARIEPHIYHRDGFVFQYSGHGLVALFPGRVEDALDAAFEILADAPAVDVHGATPGGSAGGLEVRVGIARGPVLIGTVGSDQHLTPSVMGQAVLDAQRVEAFACGHAAGVLVTGQVRTDLADGSRFVFERVGTLSESAVEVAGEAAGPDDTDSSEVFAVALA